MPTQRPTHLLNFFGPPNQQKMIRTAESVTLHHIKKIPGLTRGGHSVACRAHGILKCVATTRLPAFDEDDGQPRGSRTVSVCDGMKGASRIYLDPEKVTELAGRCPRTYFSFNSLPHEPIISRYRHGVPNNTAPKLAPAGPQHRIKDLRCDSDRGRKWAKWWYESCW